VFTRFPLHLYILCKHVQLCRPHYYVQAMLYIDTTAGWSRVQTCLLRLFMRVFDDNNISIIPVKWLR